MKHIFVDTSAWDALADKKDKDHTNALRFRKEKLDILIAENVLDVIWIDHDLAKQGWSVFEQYNSDKLWSFTDCTSYIVMKKFSITEVFAFDHHFEQMGFILLPPDL
jgi:predicted nucleic acid-binding protein